MPGHQEPTKDVISCEKPWGAANKLRSADIRMGKPSYRQGYEFIRKYIAYEREPPELKHLSRARKRNQTRFRKQWRAKSEEGQTKCRNMFGVADSVRRRQVSRIVWEDKSKSVRITQATTDNSELNPEYCGTRGIPWEAGGTTLQAKILLSDRQRSSTVRER